MRSLMFGDYMNPDLEPDERTYEEIQNLDALYTVAEQCLEEYNNTHKTRMNLVMFRYSVIVLHWEYNASPHLYNGVIIQVCCTIY